MKYTTFEGKVVDTETVSHQHLSNIYWFSKIVTGRVDKNALNRIERDFNGVILPYRPKPNFKSEIKLLTSSGYLVDKGDGIADIIFEGNIIGEYRTIESYRELIINEILK